MSDFDCDFDCDFINIIQQRMQNINPELINTYLRGFQEAQKGRIIDISENIINLINLNDAKLLDFIFFGIVPVDENNPKIKQCLIFDDILKQKHIYVIERGLGVCVICDISDAEFTKFEYELWKNEKSNESKKIELFRNHYLELYALEQSAKKTWMDIILPKNLENLEFIFEKINHEMKSLFALFEIQKQNILTRANFNDDLILLILESIDVFIYPEKKLSVIKKIKHISINTLIAFTIDFAFFNIPFSSLWHTFDETDDINLRLEEDGLFTKYIPSNINMAKHKFKIDTTRIIVQQLLFQFKIIIKSKEIFAELINENRQKIAKKYKQKYDTLFIKC